VSPAAASPGASRLPATGAGSGAVGILGGSFDPVHRGHLALAQAARAALELEQVRLMPAAQPWQKGALAASAADRAHLIELALGEQPGLVLDMHEIARGGPSYTIDTLRELRAALGPATPLVLILGGDQFDRLDTWREWQALTDCAHLAVAQRAGAALAPAAAVQAWALPRRAAPADALRRPAGAVIEFAMPPVPVSATALRAALAAKPTPEGEARLRAALGPAVLDYIRAHHLYRNPHGHQETAAHDR
jgi:nicotinate-nucleotide adenylyltransferase